MEKFSPARRPSSSWCVGTLLVALVCVALGGLLYFIDRRAAPNKPEPTTETSVPIEPTVPQTTVPTDTAPAEKKTKVLRAREIEGVASQFEWRATIPASWPAEAVPAIEAINIYDPQAAGDTNLEKSQIFIRYFSANRFLTLSTVDIFETTELVIRDRPAVRYDIQKKAGVANFPNQPSWRNERHIVTDIRVSDTNPSVFYVIAANPKLEPKVYSDFLNSLIVVDDADGELVKPIAEFEERITKKPFGVHITPATSPVQPERFSGYHTGVDVEYDDVVGDVPVLVIADGTVIFAGRADGYGGVVAVRHRINGETVIGVYGHLDPARLPAAQSSVTKGTQIGILGDGYTSETDNERKHLHFALVRGSTLNLKGYVVTESELARWHNPLDLIQ